MLSITTYDYYMTSLDNIVQHLATVRIKQQDRLLIEQIGIGLSQYRVLGTLQEKALKQRCIADMLVQTEASISRQISILVDKGLVGVRPDPTSRRQLLIGLTVKGVRVLQAAQRLLADNAAHVAAQLDGNEYGRLLASLDKLHSGICQGKH